MIVLHVVLTAFPIPKAYLGAYWFAQARIVRYHVTYVWQMHRDAPERLSSPALTLVLQVPA
jgi:hypothetical protein